MVWKFHVNTTSRETTCQFSGWNGSLKQKDLNSNNYRRPCKDKLSSLFIIGEFAYPGQPGTTRDNFLAVSIVFAMLAVTKHTSCPGW